MSWKDRFFIALDAAGLFENSGHRTRFKELMDCYSGYPFFTKGLCKCIFMSAWDEEHFNIMLETLTDMSIGRERDSDEMLIKGDAMAEEHDEDDDEYYMYKLSIAFLADQPFRLDTSARLSPEKQYVIERSLKAAEVIDRVDLETERK